MDGQSNGNETRPASRVVFGHVSGGRMMEGRRWEYGLVRVVIGPSDDNAETLASLRDLNHLGDEGWEAVGLALASDDQYQVLMKRPCSEDT